jgi:hypothetical protein
LVVALHLLEAEGDTHNLIEAGRPLDEVAVNVLAGGVEVARVDQHAGALLASTSRRTSSAKLCEV